VDLIVLKADGADRVTMRRSVTLTGDNVDAANQLIASRPGSVTASVERSGADTTVVAQTYVYLDGLSKHTFVQAVAELARTSTLLDAIGGVETASAIDQEAAVVASDAVDADAEPDSTPYVDTPVTPTPAVADSTFQPSTSPSIPQPSSIPSGIPVGQPLPTPSFTPQPVQQVQAQPAYTPQPMQQPYQAQPVQAQPAPQQAAGGWAPSHSVPSQGLRAWGAPDPSGPVVANLAPGLPIQVAEVRGAWARVICSNGWTGWIDGRIIGVAA
jgi:hypothetical protein